MVDSTKLFRWIIILVALVLGALIIRPFIAALAFAAILAYILYPTHKLLKSKIKKLPSAALITFLVVIATLSFVAWGLNFLLTEFSQAYFQITSINFTQVFQQEILGDTVRDVVTLIFSKLVIYLSDFVSKIPGILLSFFVFIMSFFYFIKDGKKIWTWFKKILPLKSAEKKQVVTEIENYVHAFVNVWLLIAVLQGIIAAIGFYLFGLNYWVIAGFAAAILSVIPILGPYLIYIPTGLFMVASGDIATGVGLMTYGLALGGILDYVIRPYYTGKWAAIHPLVVLVGIFGGLILLGAAGIILGPLLLIILIALFKGTGLKFIGGK